MEKKPAWFQDPVYLIHQIDEWITAFSIQLSCSGDMFDQVESRAEIEGVVVKGDALSGQISLSDQGIAVVHNVNTMEFTRLEDVAW